MIGRINEPYFGPKIEPNGLADERESPAQHGLTGDNRSQRGDADAKRQEPQRHDFVKRITLSQHLSAEFQNVSPLPEVVEKQADFDKYPTHPNVTAPAVAKVGIQRFGSRSTKKYRPQ